jgi:glycosyltransferase involved in cell wall biosynthesis
MSKLISVIVPAYNEEDVILAFHSRMSAVFDLIKDYRCEMIFVDDGSVDATKKLITELAASDPRVCAVSLSRNFGKEAAMTAGLDVATGDAVAIFDVDLQDPPELLQQFVASWESGFDVVYAKRARRDGETWLKKATASVFYRVIRNLSRVSIPPDTGDCRLMSRRVVNELMRLREHHRFMKGLFAWVGFPSVAIEYNRDPRVAGATKFNYWKLWNFALEGITSFTIAPLKIAMYVGFSLALASLGMGGWIVLKTLVWGEDVRGYPTLIVTVLCLGGMQLFFIGVLGEYLGRIFSETKQRPLYIVESFRESRVCADDHCGGTADSDTEYTRHVGVGALPIN